MKDIIKQFKSEGWKHRYYFDLIQGFSHKFIKNNVIIKMPTNNIDIEDGDNTVLIGWHTLYMEENAKYHLNKSGCSKFLIEIIINFINNNIYNG